MEVGLEILIREQLSITPAAHPFTITENVFFDIFPTINFEENLDKESGFIKVDQLLTNLFRIKKKNPNDHCRQWMTLKMCSSLEGD